ncbi:hypothetical protein [Novosphingobium sp. Chol11]|uniref:hypothetical protein n=1 Tax=Novosphingobium sp. Chol11 TaxID=1385763 RepID=UPI0026010C14|nr:hypothetical protein [Novosphingobium sp. Chol11]
MSNSETEPASPPPTASGQASSSQTSLAMILHGLSGWVGPAISLSILAAVFYQLRKLDWAHVWEIVPTSPVIWLVFVASYFTGPVADWIIFRKLWGIPFSGLIPLIKKLIGNELLLGYIGEVYFYDWARRRVKMEGSPFGAVKDVAILSALAGNLLTFIMLAIAWPLIAELGFSKNGHLLTGSIAIVLFTSALIMLFRKGLIGLPRADLIYVFTVHTLRILVGTGLNALVWHLILPQVSIGSWLLLSTIRLLLSRLPLLPNKDLAFAAITTFFIGQEIQTGYMITMISLMIVAMHIMLFISLTLLDLVQREKNA